MFLSVIVTFVHHVSWQSAPSSEKRRRREQFTAQFSRLGSFSSARSSNVARPSFTCRFFVPVNHPPRSSFWSPPVSVKTATARKNLAHPHPPTHPHR